MLRSETSMSIQIKLNVVHIALRRIALLNTYTRNIPNLTKHKRMN